MKGSKKQHKIQMQKILRKQYRPKNYSSELGGLNPNPYGSYPLQLSSNLHNPLTLESNLQTHMLAYANPKKLIQWLNIETT
jgi:hypothetical protein